MRFIWALNWGINKGWNQRLYYQWEFLLSCLLPPLFHRAASPVARDLGLVPADIKRRPRCTAGATECLLLLLPGSMARLHAFHSHLEMVQMLRDCSAARCFSDWDAPAARGENTLNISSCLLGPHYMTACHTGLCSGLITAKVVKLFKWKAVPPCNRATQHRSTASSLV